MAEPIHLGPKPTMQRNPLEIFRAAVTIFSIDNGQSIEEAFDSACELWDRAHGTFVSEEE